MVGVEVIGEVVGERGEVVDAEVVEVSVVGVEVIEVVGEGVTWVGFAGVLACASVHASARSLDQFRSMWEGSGVGGSGWVFGAKRSW